MGHIKEPKGIDLIVSPMPYSEEDRKAISAIITAYKQTKEAPKSPRQNKKAKPAKKTPMETQH